MGSDGSGRSAPPAHDDPEQLVPEDDRIVGRVFWGSVAVLAVGGAVAGGWMLWGRFGPAKPPPAPVQPAAPAMPAPRVAAPEIPAVPFKDVTAESGVAFERVNGADGRKLLPETLGGGGGFMDADMDGDPDLILVDGDRWPDASDPNAPRGRGVVLLLNDGRGHFTAPAAPTGLETPGPWMGAAAGDLDGDGRTDLVVTGVEGLRAYRNDSRDGVIRFTDVTDAWGLKDGGWSTAAVIFDADGDGRLDLLVGHYVKWSPEIDAKVDYRLTGIGRAYGPPLGFEGTRLDFWRNEGDGRFADRTAEAGFEVLNPATRVPVAKTLGLLVEDFNGDGLPDVMVANDRVQNFLFINQGKGVFREAGVGAGVAFDRSGAARGAMGIDAARMGSPERMAIAVGNFANEPTSLFCDRGGKLAFSDDSLVEGVGAPSRTFLKFGTLFTDLDLDGRPDLVTANGHLEEQIAAVQASQHYRQRAQAFWNAGPSSGPDFVEIPAGKLGDLAREMVGRGLAAADVDGDGDVDLLLMQPAGPPLLLRNDQGTGNHWLRVRLEGRAPNREAIGAMVDCITPAGTQRHFLSPARSYLSLVELPLTFGLGAAEKATIQVRWPDGTTSSVESPADRSVTIAQPPAAPSAPGSGGSPAS